MQILWEKCKGKKQRFFFQYNRRLVLDFISSSNPQLLSGRGAFYQKSGGALVFYQIISNSIGKLCKKYRKNDNSRKKFSKFTGEMCNKYRKNDYFQRIQLGKHIENCSAPCFMRHFLSQIPMEKYTKSTGKMTTSEKKVANLQEKCSKSIEKTTIFREYS